MINYQSEYDRIRNELSNSALPFQTKEGVITRKAKLEQMGVKLNNSISQVKFQLYTYVYIMNNSIKEQQRKPTYDELIHEASIHPTDKIKYPKRIATQLRTTPR